MPLCYKKVGKYFDHVADIQSQGKRTKAQAIVLIIGQLLCYAMSRTAKEVSDMRGYYSSFGYCGLVDGRYRLFATEEDYRDYMMQR